MKSKLFLVVFLMCVIYSNSNSQQDVNGWYWLNGKPTGNTLKWVKIIAIDNIVAVGERGTFMKSVDGGDTWSVNSQVGSPDNSSTGNLATRVLNTGWFFDANTGIVAGQSLSSSNGRISKTTDGGNSWNYIQYNITGGVVNSFYFVNSSTGYLAGSGNARFYKTTDQGQTWLSQPYNPPLPAVTIGAVFALDTGNIFAVNFNSRTVYYHKQGMDSAWKVWSLPGTTGQLRDITFINSNTGFVCGTGNYFAYTTNGGNNWTQTSVSPGVSFNDLLYSGGKLYLTGDAEYIFKSSNNGVTWDSLYFRDNSNINQPQMNTMNCLSINGSDMAVVGQIGTVNISNDGGESWRNKNYSVSNNNGTLNYTSLLVQTTGSSVTNIWLGPAEVGGNIIFSSNAGANWTTKPNSSPGSVFGIHFVTSDTGYVCGSPGYVGKTTNGGNTWTTLSLPTPMNASQLNNLSFINANTGWVTGILTVFDPAVVYKTTNGGITWTTQSLQGNPLGATAYVHLLDANNGFLLANTLYSTTNGGVNWTASTNPYLSLAPWLSLLVFSKDIIYLCGPGGPGFGGPLNKIIRTTDGGLTWTDLTSGTLPNLYIFNTKWLNLKHGIVCGSNGFFGKTTDGGTTWAESNPGGTTIVDCAIPKKNEVYAIGDFRSSNTAYTVWRKNDNLTSISVNVTMGIEGFWNGKPMITDTVTVELRNSIFPYALVDQGKEVVTINGYATYEFYSAPAGSYYIAVKHRNSLETWSAAPVAMNAGGNYNYDFTSSASQAFGNNVKFKAGIYCNYSGDVIQDGIIDASDLATVENNVGNSGYLPEDLTGDDFVDAADVALVENNQGVSLVSP